MYVKVNAEPSNAEINEMCVKPKCNFKNKNKLHNCHNKILCIN